MLKKYRYIIVILLILTFCKNAVSQKTYINKKDSTTRRGLYFGGNVGVFLANKYTANYYNGTDSTGNPGQRISSIFQYSQNYEKIKQALGGYDFTIAELPLNMKYSPSAYIGFHVRYLFSNYDAFLFQANYSKVKASDIFTLKLQTPNFSNPEATYYKADIWGIEDRVNIDVGYSRIFSLSENIFLGLEGGINFNSVRVKESKIKIEGMQFSITDPSYNYYNIVEGGVNAGAFITANIQLWLNNVLSLEHSYTCYYSEIKLGENQKYKPQSVIFARLIYKY